LLLLLLIRSAYCEKHHFGADIDIDIGDEWCTVTVRRAAAAAAAAILLNDAPTMQ
jgi:hypothetical protein